MKWADSRTSQRNINFNWIFKWKNRIDIDGANILAIENNPIVIQVQFEQVELVLGKLELQKYFETDAYKTNSFTWIIFIICCGWKFVGKFKPFPFLKQIFSGSGRFNFANGMDYVSNYVESFRKGLNIDLNKKPKTQKKIIWKSEYDVAMWRVEI